jgi:hypothetical protein
MKLLNERWRTAVGGYSIPNDVSPEEALLQEVHRAAGHVAFLEASIGAQVPEALAGAWMRYKRASTITGVSTQEIESLEELQVYIGVYMELYYEERRMLLKAAETALRAGVEERKVRIQESQAELVGTAISAMLRDLGHDINDPTVRAVAYRAMQALEGAA